MWEGLIQVWDQVVLFFTQNEFIQNISSTISPLIAVWFANKTVTLTKDNLLAKTITSEKDAQIAELKTIVEQQNDKINTLGAMFMEAFGQSNLKAEAKKNVALLYTNFEKVKLDATKQLEGLASVKDTVQQVIQTQIEEQKESIIDKLSKGV